MRKRRKELGDRAIGSEARRRCARLKRDIVYIITVQNNQDIFKTKVRGDGESSCEVRGGPLAVMNGAGAGSVSGKGRLEGLNAGAGARENRRVRDRTEARCGRTFLAGRCDTFSEGVEVSERGGQR